MSKAKFPAPAKSVFKPKQKSAFVPSKNYYRSKKSSKNSVKDKPISSATLSRRINKTKKDYFEQHVKKPESELLRIIKADHKKLVTLGTSTVMTSAAIGVISHLTKGLANRSAKEYPYIEKDSTAPASTVGDINRYTTKFVTGMPPSRSVSMTKEMLGSTTYKLFDTSCDLKANRQFLSSNFGFNQKRYIFLGSKLTPEVGDYYELFGVKDFKYPQFENQTIYGLALEERLVLKLANANKYLPINVKIHLIEMLDAEVSMAFLFGLMFNPDISQEPQNGRMPAKYQLQDPYTNTHSFDWLSSVVCAKSARLNMSTVFNQNAHVVKTFSKKLERSAIWKFDLRVLLGSGVPLDQTFYDYKVRNNSIDRQPSNYGIVLEYCGSECMGVQNNNGIPTDYVGTSPGGVAMEVMKSFEVVNADVTPTNLGYQASKAAMKLFRRDVNDEKDFNVDVSDISLTIKDDGFFIPVMSDEQVKTGGIIP